MTGPVGGEAGKSTGADVFTVHGGNLAAARARFKGAPEPWLDLSTGINPIAYPIPPISQSAWTRLPEQAAVAALEAAAARAYGAPLPNMVVAAPGTQALIQLLPRVRPARDVRILGFSYAEHRKAWERSGATVAVVDTLDALAGAQVAVVVNPNNPDGRLVEPDRLRDFARANPYTHLVIDEAFADVLAPEASILPRLPGNTVVLRSFGKTYGLAGVRLGFAVVMPQGADRLHHELGPWAVSGPALAVGRAALEDVEWLNEAKARLARDAARLDRLLSGAGFEPAGGTPLFRFVRTPDASKAFTALAHQGVLVRRFEGWPGVLRFGLPGYEDDWTRLAERLTEVG
ncbi:threonine-phosphate decarboxylase CobD [uncultured Alsobacter sp.]|uniref:threonine-phosphate decarboxylase CobD n=1 Tax=uncultured Alsobacter sp. TaxID=1748258 RepID=UPI0025DA7D8B|nr:threonine-phosphate decarboxylase CobD [uncultured Alsobacter sp.]